MGGGVLRPQDPGVVRQSSRRIGSHIRVDQFASTRDANSRIVGIEREVFRVLHEVEQVGVRTAEATFAIHAKRVVPDHPTSRVKANFSLGQDLQLRGEFVADREPKSAVGFERAMDAANPLAAPAQVVVRVAAVVIDVVVVADVERRVGEHQINRSRFELVQ